MHRAKAIMIQGTGSHVGKSILTAALCRILKRKGYHVAPFKSQNMALNSYVTADGLEMGRAQVVQAEAAGIPPRVEMNPILLKATSDVGCQVIMKGKVHGNMTAVQYHQFKEEAWGTAVECYDRLAAEFEVIVIEGAGSPAEINLKEHDIVNMRVAKMADAPVLLAADIDRGGVFASLVGTMELLEKEERARVAGFIINKFRGDKALLQPGIDFLTQKTGIPTVGVIPWLLDLRVQQEDGVALERGEPRGSRGDMGGPIRVNVIRLPHISNFTDFDALSQEASVDLGFVGPKDKVTDARVVIIPGSKNTIADLRFLKQWDLDAEIRRYHADGGVVVGICGGYQMMGRVVRDPWGVESDRGEEEGLGILDVETVLERDKVTRLARALPLYLPGAPGDTPVEGYEIHMGQTSLGLEAKPLLRLTHRGYEPVSEMDGAVSPDGRAWGTYLHGIFDNDALRAAFLKGLGGGGDVTRYEEIRQKGLDELADEVERHMDMSFVEGLIRRHGS